MHDQTAEDCAQHMESGPLPLFQALNSQGRYFSIVLAEYEVSYYIYHWNPNR